MKTSYSPLSRAALFATVAFLACITSAKAADIAAFWSFDTVQDGSGAFTSTVTAETFPDTPTLSFAGSNLTTTSGATSFTDYTGATWTGNSTVGHSVGWSSGSTGNSLSVRLDTTGVSSLQVRMDLRSFTVTGALTSFSSFSYSLDGGNTFIPSGLNMTFNTSTSFQSVTYSLAGLTAINDQPSVILRWTLDDVPSGTSLRIDNLQITGTGSIPEPASAGLLVGLLMVSFAVSARRRGLRSVG